MALSAAVAYGDTWVRAKETTLSSDNGAYTIRIVPGDSWGDTFGFARYPKGAFATATLDGPGEGDEVRFELVNPIAPVEAILTDDGSLLTFDNWHHRGYGKVVARYDANGKALWSHELHDLLPSNWIDNHYVRHTTSSRHWRKRDDSWSIRGTGTDRSIFVTLWNEHLLKIRLGDGLATFVFVDDLGDDADAWFRWAKDVAARAAGGDASAGEAIEALRHVIRLDPRIPYAYRELSDVYARKGDLRSAAAILEKGVGSNPIGELPSSNGGYQSNARLNLRLALARLDERDDRLAEAERVLVDCLSIDPGFWLAGQELSDLLFEQGRRDEADALLEAFYEMKLESGSFSAALDVGDMYARHDLYETAKRYFVERLERDFPNTSLYTRLASVHEALQEYDEALGVLEAHGDYLLKLMEEERRDGQKEEYLSAYFSTKIDAVENEIARLRSISR